MRRRFAGAAATPVRAFWTESLESLLARLDATTGGLSTDEARRRLKLHGRNADAPARRRSAVRALVRRLVEPLALILLIAGIVVAATGDVTGGVIIVAILCLSISLDTLQEGHAGRAAEALRRSVVLTAEALRDGRFTTVPVDLLAPGDIVRVRAGDIVPADARVLESAAFTADEATLTGEPYPVEKKPGLISSPSPAEASNAVFRGSVAQSGEALVLVAATGPATLFGSAASVLAREEETSPFEHDLRSFGLLTARATVGLVLIVLLAHVLLGRPALPSLLFAVALAVGLTPELLPMITTVTLSRGAVRLAKRKVIVKRLASIHDLGAMSVLCTDKTGTLTSAQITLAHSQTAWGDETPRPAMLGSVAARLGGERSALDGALATLAIDTDGWSLIASRGFDYTRRFSLFRATGPGGPLTIIKGAPEAVLPLCSSVRNAAGTRSLDAPLRDAAVAQARRLSESGLRAIVVATRSPPEDSREEASDLILEGFCAFADPPKPTAAAAISRLAAGGVRLKVLSGDDPVVVSRLARAVGLKAGTVLTGAEIAALSDDALSVKVRDADLFGRLTPDQKARVVRAVQTDGQVVGYLGDGINDAPALKTADIGLSVSGASGVAQAAADMILLAPDLEVVCDGVNEGRRTFANILKYLRMGASSNFGNMLSMAGASLFLPFLPMAPTQILLNNLLYDVSEIGIPFDSVREEGVARPQIWDLKLLLRFAVVMGPLSSLFDLLTFWLLIVVFKAPMAEFQTAWFIESMATQILVIFIIRTPIRFWRDRPSGFLTLSSLLALAAAMTIPFTPLAIWFGFVPPPPALALALTVLVAVYLAFAVALNRIAVGPAGAAAAR